MIGKEKIGPFTKYAIQRYLNLLNNRAVLFERFIVHKMYSQTLQQWNELVRSYRDMIRVPLVLEATSTALHLINSKRLTTLPDALQIIKLYPMFELAYVIQHYLPLIVDKAMTQELEEIDTAWTLMVMDVRQKLALPPSCKHGRMNQLVWQAIEHFKCVNFVEFRDTLQVMLESVEFVEVIPDEHDLVIQFVIAFSDVANLPSKFLLLDSLIMKQNKVPAFKTTDHNIYRWSCLESGVLKLIANDDALTERYVACGKKLMQLTNCYAKS